MAAGGRRALITGAGGFVGRRLARRLADNGWQVLSCDVTAPEGASGWRACDVADAAQVGALLDWARDVTHIFHLAAITFVPDSGREPARTFAVNTAGTAHLAHGLVQRAMPARLIFIGSAEAYGNPRALPVTEDHPLAPVNPYAISKAAADQFCAWAHAAIGLDVIRMRPFNHSGPGQSDQFVLSAFARQLARIEAGKQPPEIRVGNLDAARDFSHVDDIVRGYEQAALHGQSGEAYNICSGEAVPVADALRRLVEKTAAHAAIVPDPERLRAVEVPAVWGDYGKLQRATGWRPEKNLDQLLEDLLDYWRQIETAVSP